MQDLGYHSDFLVFGPFVPNVGATSPSGKLIRFGELEDLREALEIDGSKIAAFMVEPIQGSAGYGAHKFSFQVLICSRIVAPSTGYLKQVAALCKKYNVLFIADEVQTGLGRTGANLSHLREGVRPDLVVLGKALAGGTPLHCSDEQSTDAARDVSFVRSHGR